MENLMKMRDDEATSHSDMSEEITQVDYQRGATHPLEYRDLRTEWTNEKHCLYLKSMEASFVNELFRSMGQAHKYVSMKKESSHQIKSCRHGGGSWRNGSLFKYGSKSGATSKFRSLADNQWVRHYRRADKNQVQDAIILEEIVVNPDNDFKSELKLFPGFDKQLASLSRRNAAGGNNTEMMDQNFDANDQGIEEKRNKTETTSKEENDQVVPVISPKDSRYF